MVLAKQRVMSLPVRADTLELPLACSPCHSCRAQQGAMPPSKTLALAASTASLQASLFRRFCVEQVHAAKLVLLARGCGEETC